MIGIPYRSRYVNSAKRGIKLSSGEIPLKNPHNRLKRQPSFKVNVSFLITDEK